MVHRQLRTSARKIGGAALIALLACGCSVNSEDLLFVRPGTYDYYRCPDIAKARQAAQESEEKLRALIARAEQESVGVLIAATAYRSQYLKAQGDIRQLDEVARQKKCPPMEPTGPTGPKSS
jgi:hypothetical protein